MKTKQNLEFVVEPQDVLKKQLQSIKGGTATDIKCNPEGIILCHPTGKVKSTQSISAW